MIEHRPGMDVSKASLVLLMHRYLCGLMDPFVTLLELHKLLYFMQEAGEPLDLEYTKALHGPYAANLRPMLHAVESNLISGYADGDDAPATQLELIPGAVQEAEVFLNDKRDTAIRCDRVAKLVEGFETPFGLELLATVHWVATRENPAGEDDVTTKVHAWNERKKRFSRRQIGIAFETLRANGWLAA